jgi:hypothetical protein
MPGSDRIYMFHVPSDSPVKFGPASFRPTIRVEGRHVAISSSADSARLALEAVRKKGWKPPADVDQALAHVPHRLIMLMLSDPRETVPGLLASLPGTLQAQINTVIAMSGSGTGGTQAGGPGPGPAAGGQGPGFSGGPGRMMMRRGGREEVGGGGGPGGPRSGGYPGFSGGGPPGGSGGFSGGGPPGGSGGFSGGGPPRGYYGGASGGPAGPGGSGSAEDAMIQLKVDPATLPKAEELKALMFPGTWAVAVDDQSIRFVSREAFPNLVTTATMGGLSGAVLAPALAQARARAAANGPAGQPGQGTTAPAPGGQPGAGAPPAAGSPPGPAADPRGGPPRGRGGRRPGPGGAD